MYSYNKMLLVVAAITFKFYRKFYCKFYCTCDSPLVKQCDSGKRRLIRRLRAISLHAVTVTERVIVERCELALLCCHIALYSGTVAWCW